MVIYELTEIIFNKNIIIVDIIIAHFSIINIKFNILSTIFFLVGILYT